MEISHRQVGSTVLLEFAKPVNLEGEDSVAFRDRVKALIADGRTRIVVDLGQVKFIDSFGLGSLVSALRVVRSANGDLKLAHVPSSVESVLRLTRLNTVFEIHATCEDALKSFQEAG